LSNRIMERGKYHSDFTLAAAAPATESDAC
jgi:hypothetical protein